MSDIPEPFSASLSSSGYEDGLGRRGLVFDRETGAIRERLVLRPEIAAFERTLAERVSHAALLEDERFARPQSVGRDPQTGAVVVLSEYVQGTRLSDLLDAVAGNGPGEMAPPGLDAAIGFLLDMLPALGALHAAAGFAHGAAGAGHTLLTPVGQVVLQDWVFGDVLARLGWNRRRLWRELGIAVPAGEDAGRFDASADIAQAAVSAVLLITGRPLDLEDSLDPLTAAIPEIVEIAQIRGTAEFAGGVQRFLQRALPLPGSRPFPGADEAAAAVRQLAREIGAAECRAALAGFVTDLNRLAPGPARPGAAATSDADLEESDALDIIEERDAQDAFEVVHEPDVLEDERADIWSGDVEAARTASASLEFEIGLDDLAPSSAAPDPALVRDARDTEADAAEAESITYDISDVASDAGRQDDASRTTVLEADDSAPVGVDSVPPVGEPGSNPSTEQPLPLAGMQDDGPVLVRADELDAPSYSQPVPSAGTPSAFDALPPPEPVATTAQGDPGPRAEPTLPLAASNDVAAPPPAPGAPASERPVQPAAAAPPPARKRRRGAKRDRDKLRSDAKPPAPAPGPSPEMVSKPPEPVPAAPVTQTPPSVPSAPVVQGPPAVRAAPPPVPHAAPPMPYYPPREPVPSWTTPAPVPTEWSPPAEFRPAPIASSVRIKSEPPPGYSPLGKHRTVEAADAMTAVPYVNRGTSPAGSSTWKAVAAAAVVVVAIAAVAGRAYWLKDRPTPSAAVSTPAAVSAPAAEAPVGTLTLATEPAGAKVILDGEPAGETPLTIEKLAAGRHTVAFVTAAGTVRRTVRIEAGKTSALDVAVYSGWVAVFAPVVMDISENGRSIGTTDQGRIMLPPGRHQLTFTNRELGYKASQTVTIEAGEERSVNLQATGELNLNALPWAEVWLDGQKVGDTPIAGLAVPLGTHEVLFKHPELGQRTITAIVRADAPTAAAVDFSRPPSE